MEWTKPIETAYEKEYRLRARKRAAVIAVLQQWYERMIMGTVDMFEPDLSSAAAVTFKKTPGEIVAGIDYEFAKELAWNERGWREDGITKAPHFSELGGKAMLCLVQDLRKALDAC